MHKNNNIQRYNWFPKETSVAFSNQVGRYHFFSSSLQTKINNSQQTTMSYANNHTTFSPSFFSRQPFSMPTSQFILNMFAQPVSSIFLEVKPACWLSQCDPRNTKHHVLVWAMTCLLCDLGPSNTSLLPLACTWDPQLASSMESHLKNFLNFLPLSHISNFLP